MNRSLRCVLLAIPIGPMLIGCQSNPTGAPFVAPAPSKTSTELSRSTKITDNLNITIIKDPTDPSGFGVRHRAGKTTTIRFRNPLDQSVWLRFEPSPFSSKNTCGAAASLMIPKKQELICELTDIDKTEYKYQIFSSEPPQNFDSVTPCKGCFIEGDQ